MAVVVRYHPASLTKEQYEAGGRLLMERSPEPGPPGDLLVHVCFGDDGSLHVSEIWESEDAWREAWDGFLKPTLEEAGTTFEAEPEVFEAHALWGAGVPAPQPS